MSADRMMENLHKEIQEFLDSQATSDMSIDQLNELLQKHIVNMPGERRDVTPKTAKTADDFVYLAEEEAEDRETTLKYAQKALFLDPDNLDAQRIVAQTTAGMICDRLDRLETAVQHGTQIMESKGYMDEEYIGKFWGVVETRPYMRLRSAFMETLLAAGMMRRAAEECEAILRLCEGDNLGIRYVLMHVYAFLEDEEKALKLHEKYDDFEETQMLLPLSVLYYKLRCMDRAKEYLDRVVKANPDTKRFFRALRQDRLEELEAEISDFGYRPFTFEELVVEYRENEFLFRTVEAYGRWADRQLIVKKKQ